MTSIGKMVPAFFLAFVCLGQSSHDLQSRFPQVVSYEISPGILMTPRYAADGQVCEMVVEKRHKKDGGIDFGSSFSEKELKELVNELVPEKERGEDQTEFLNSTIDGGFVTTEYSYENIVVTVRGITRPRPEDMVVVITWRKRTCGQGEAPTVSSTEQNKPVNSAQKPASDLPKVIRASVPSYPELARQTRIQGTVTLRVSTDGKLVSAVDAENGHRLLANAAKENVKTWQFEPHVPTSFTVTFRYNLLPVKCDSRCNCDGKEKESVLLQLPTSVHISAKGYMTCDPAVEVRRKN